MKMEMVCFIDESGNPQRLLQAPGIIDEEVLDEIPQLILLKDKSKIFTHSFKTFKSANILFEISNPKDNISEKMLISIIITEGIIDLKTSQGLLEGFRDEILGIEDIYKCLYARTKKYEGCREKFAEIQKLFFNFSKSFPEENIIFREKQDVSIFIYGLDQAGKTALINGVKRNFKIKTLPTTNVDISRIKVKNISVRAYDAPGQVRFHGLWEPYLKMKQDGLIFVLDVVHRMRYETAKELLHRIANYPNLKRLPLLILFNKVDLVKPDLDQLIDEMDVDILIGRPVKCFLTSATHNIGIDESFEWITQEISNVKSQEA